MSTQEQRVEAALRDLLGDRPGAMLELVLAARRLVTELAPGSSEILYLTHAISNVFTFTAKPGDGFIHIAVYARHVNMGFNRGAFLDDPHGLLEGTGKAIRHVRLDGEETLRRPELSELIERAAAQGADAAARKGGRAEQVFIDKTTRSNKA
ncbi:MAG: DUF1801 domain-containing protein [Acidobacteriota bacterium]